MHLLIIGNGFDIAHYLPTKYPEFLSFCRNYGKINPILEDEKLNAEFKYILESNIWLKYFFQLTGKFSTAKLGKTWIDFEKEIADIIQIIEDYYWIIEVKRNSRTQNTFTMDWRQPSSKLNDFLRCFGKYDNELKLYVLSAENVTDMDSFVKYLYIQLRQFTRAFEIYCLRINTISSKEPIIFSDRGTQIKKARRVLDTYSKQLADAEKNNLDNAMELKQLVFNASATYQGLLHDAYPIDYLSMGKFDCVLSFNYTNTYERLYGDTETKYCYIHGKAQENPKCTNMILGIDDHLPDGQESKNFSCVNFKKYYQRIIFKTGSEYRDWLHPTFKLSKSVNYVHIVGHSLDRTDHDVLYEFFSDERFRIIIYYYSPKDFEEKVQKVIQLLASKGRNGRDELISRVHGKHWTIKFTYLYDENQGLFRKPSQSETGNDKFESQ